MFFFAVDVALRAASILKNHMFVYLLNALHVAEHLYLLRFEHQEYARTLSFGKCCRMHQSMTQTHVGSPTYDQAAHWTRIGRGEARIGRVWDADCTRIGRGWEADGTRMGRGCTQIHAW